MLINYDDTFEKITENRFNWLYIKLSQVGQYKTCLNSHKNIIKKYCYCSEEKILKSNKYSLDFSINRYFNNNVFVHKSFFDLIHIEYGRDDRAIYGFFVIFFKYDFFLYKSNVVWLLFFKMYKMRSLSDYNCLKNYLNNILKFFYFKNSFDMFEVTQFTLNLWSSKKDICASLTENKFMSDMFFYQKHLIMFIQTNVFIKYLKLKKQLRKKNQILILMFKYIRRLLITSDINDFFMNINYKITAYKLILKNLFYPANELYIQPFSKKIILDINYDESNKQQKLNFFKEFFFNNFYLNNSQELDFFEAEWSRFTDDFFYNSVCVIKKKNLYFRYYFNTDYIFFSFKCHNFKSQKNKKKKSLKKRMVKRIVSSCYNRSWIF